MQTLNILPMELFPEKWLSYCLGFYTADWFFRPPHMGLFSHHLNIPGYILGEVGQREQCLEQPCGLWCSLLPGPLCAWALLASSDLSSSRHSWVTRGKAWPTDHLEAADDVKKIHIRYRDGGHTNSNKSDHNG